MSRFALWAAWRAAWRATCLAIAVAAVAAVAVQPAAAQQEPQKIADEILGDWQLKPVEGAFKMPKTCAYHQWIRIRRGPAADALTGTARSWRSCGNRKFAANVTRLIITIKGRNIVIGATGNDGWWNEYVVYEAPDQMKGQDALGHRLIYRRPKAPPTS